MLKIVLHTCSTTVLLLSYSLYDTAPWARGRAVGPTLQRGAARRAEGTRQVPEASVSGQGNLEHLPLERSGISNMASAKMNGQMYI